MSATIDLLRVQQHRVLVHQVALEDRDVAPCCTSSVELGVGDLPHHGSRGARCRGTRSCVTSSTSCSRHSAHAICQARIAGPAICGRERVAGGDEDLAPLGEDRLDVERVDDRVEAVDEARVADVRVERQPEQPEDLLVAAAARLLQLARGSRRRLVDLLDEARRSRTSAASVCFETLIVGLLLVAAPPLQVERVRVGAAEDRRRAGPRA